MLPEGFYYLTAEVKNPCPDGRYRTGLMYAPYWHEGTRVYLKHPTLDRDGDMYSGVIEFADGTEVLYGDEKKSKSLKYKSQGNGIIPCLRAAELTVGQLLYNSRHRSAALVLAAIVDNALHIDDLKNYFDKLNAMSDEEIAELEKKHEVS